MHKMRERNPMVLRGSPYDDNAEDREVTVSIPALSKSLDALGETFSIMEACAKPENRPLTTEQRRKILDQAILVLGELYVHRDLKRTRHAVDPVTALRQLKRRCDELTGFDFHLEVMKIFKGLRDIHTAYIMPKPYSDMVAFLPFLLAAHTVKETAAQEGQVLGEEELGEDTFDPDSERRVIVTGLLDEFTHPHFKPGVEILSWNGMPIHEAIRRIGEEEQGSNIYAQFELGLRLMTVRWFGGSLPPSEYFVTIVYRDDEEIREIRFPWRVMLDNTSRGRVASVQAMWTLKKKFENNSSEDPSVEPRSLFETTVRDQLYSVPEEIEFEKKVTKISAEIEGLPPGIFDVHFVKVDHGPDAFKFGMVKIENFVCGRKAFVEGFMKILNAVPQTGLVIDIRSNPGGLVSAAESILQLLSPRRITPLPFQFLATTLAEDIVRSDKTAARMKLDTWADKVTPAVNIGNQFSRNGSLTRWERANEIGQRYYGPITLITNAVTYSSGDIFAASFQDHEIGPVIGTDPSTGGGGANMWTHRDCVDMAMPDQLLEHLPGGARHGPKLHYAVRRCVRVGRNQGMPIEEEGVRRDCVYNLTRDDLLSGDVDLLRFAGRVLQEQNKKQFKVEIKIDGAPVSLSESVIKVPANGKTARVDIDIDLGHSTSKIEHIISIGGKFQKAVNIVDGRASFNIDLDTARPSIVRVETHDVDPDSGYSKTLFATFVREVQFEAQGQMDPHSS